MNRWLEAISLVFGLLFMNSKVRFLQSPITRLQLLVLQLSLPLYILYQPQLPLRLANLHPKPTTAYSELMISSTKKVILCSIQLYVSTQFYNLLGSVQNKVLDYLLSEERANPNLPNKEGDLALHIAAGNGQIDTLRLLLKHKAAVQT